MAGMTLPQPSIVLITGVMAAGKSTVAQGLAESLPRSVHLRGDVFRRMIVRGRADITPDLAPDARTQLDLRYGLAVSAARQYVQAGFTVVYQDVLLEEDLTRAVRGFSDLPLYVVVLCPPPAVVAAREAQRGKRGYGGGWTVPDLDASLRRSPRVGWWVDTGALTPRETVEAILRHLPDARVERPPLGTAGAEGGSA